MYSDGSLSLHTRSLKYGKVGYISNLSFLFLSFYKVMQGHVCEVFSFPCPNQPIKTKKIEKKKNSSSQFKSMMLQPFLLWEEMWSHMTFFL